MTKKELIEALEPYDDDIEIKAPTLESLNHPRTDYLKFEDIEVDYKKKENIIVIY